MFPGLPGLILVLFGVIVIGIVAGVTTVFLMRPSIEEAVQEVVERQLKELRHENRIAGARLLEYVRTELQQELVNEMKRAPFVIRGGKSENIHPGSSA